MSGFRPSIYAFGEAGTVDENVEKRSINNNYGGADARNPNALGVLYRQPLYLGGKTLAQRDLALFTIDKSHNLLKSQTQDTLLDVVIVYADVVMGQYLLEIRRNHQKVLQDQLEITQEYVALGELTKTDLAQAKSRLSRANADLRSAKNVLDNARAGFFTVVGQLPDTLQGFNYVKSLPLSLDDAIDKALAKNPIIKSAQADLSAQDAKIDIISADYRPQMYFESTTLKEEDPTFDDKKRTSTEAKVTIKIPLYEAGMVSAAVRQAKKERYKASYLAADVRRGVVKNITIAWNERDNSNYAIDASIAEQKAASEAEQGVIEESQLGFRTTIDVLNAHQETLQAQTNLIKAKRDKMVAEYALLAAIGDLTIKKIAGKTIEYDPKEHLDRIKGLRYGWWQK